MERVQQELHIQEVLVEEHLVLEIVIEVRHQQHQMVEQEEMVQHIKKAHITRLLVEEQETKEAMVQDMEEMAEQATMEKTEQVGFQSYMQITYIIMERYQQMV